MPLTFSRRHGDPSRPWNQFSIEIKNEDGTPKSDFQGNWRDIFQNWEALSISYPGYIENIISKFVNASTPDGYNPYRTMRNGIDWEAPDPETHGLILVIGAITRLFTCKNCSNYQKITILANWMNYLQKRFSLMPMYLIA